MPGASMGMVNLGDIFGKAMGGRTRKRRMTVEESHDVLIAEESDKLLDDDSITAEAITNVELNGIVFLDERSAARRPRPRSSASSWCARQRPSRRCR